MGCGCAGSTRRPAADQAGVKKQDNGARADAGYTWNGPKRKPAVTAPAK